MRDLSVGRNARFGGNGFRWGKPAATGRPSYHPSVLSRLYIYGYLKRVQSSRRLEREAGRTGEVMWLLGRPVPDHKTIADSAYGSKADCRVGHPVLEKPLQFIFMDSLRAPTSVVSGPKSLRVWKRGFRGEILLIFQRPKLKREYPSSIPLRAATQSLDLRLRSIYA